MSKHREEKYYLFYSMSGNPSVQHWISPKDIHNSQEDEERWNPVRQWNKRNPMNRLKECSILINWEKKLLSSTMHIYTYSRRNMIYIPWHVTTCIYISSFCTLCYQLQILILTFIFQTWIMLKIIVWKAELVCMRRCASGLVHAPIFLLVSLNGQSNFLTTSCCSCLQLAFNFNQSLVTNTIFTSLI